MSKLTVCVLHVRPQLLLLLTVSKGARGVAAFLLFQNVVTYLPRIEPTKLNICQLFISSGRYASVEAELTS